MADSDNEKSRLVQQYPEMYELSSKPYRDMTGKADISGHGYSNSRCTLAELDKPIYAFFIAFTVHDKNE